MHKCKTQHKQNVVNHNSKQNTMPNYRNYKTLNALRIEAQKDGMWKCTLFDLKAISTTWSKNLYFILEEVFFHFVVMFTHV
jgi:hypothetical protein